MTIKDFIHFKSVLVFMGDRDGFKNALGKSSFCGKIEKL